MNIFDKRVPKKGKPVGETPKKKPTTTTQSYRPDVKLNALPEEILLAHPNYYPILHPITKRSEITLENAHRIAQADENNQKTEAFNAYRIGDIPGVENQFPGDKYPFVFTASALPNVLGMYLKPACSLFKSDYYSQKKEQEFLEYATGKLRIKQNTMMEYGNWHENNGLYNFIEHMNQTLPMKVYQIGSFRKQLIDGKNIWFAATPDFLWQCVDIDGFFGTGEIKNKTPWFETDTGFIRWHKNTMPSSELPYYYIPQFMMQMYVTDMEYGYFVSNSGKNGAKIFLYKRDGIYINMILELLREYHQNYVIEKKKIPESGNPFESSSGLYKKFLNRTFMLQQLDPKHNPFIISTETCKNYDFEAIGKYNQHKRRRDHQQEIESNKVVEVEV